jgi:hypothetical protein
MRWFRPMFTRRRSYDELSETIREHLEEKLADLIDRGMSRWTRIWDHWPVPPISTATRNTS